MHDLRPGAPRRAIILAAGLGSRLHPLTADRPKAMVSMLGEPALHRSIRQMAQHGITEIGVVVGYKSDVVERETGRQFFGANITYVVSDEYAHTGTAVSLFRAIPLMTDDTIILEADVLFEDRLLCRMLEHSAVESLAGVAAFEPPLSGTVVTMTSEGKILSFTRGVEAGQMTGSFKTVNLYRFTERFIFKYLTPALERTISLEPRAYLEDVLADLVTKHDALIRGVDCTDCIWFEVDDYTDLEYARDLFRQETRGGLC